jgi:hypothetical protein
MQPCARIGAQSYDVAGVRGDFRLKEYDVEHAVRDWYGRPRFLIHPLRGKSTAKAHAYPDSASPLVYRLIENCTTDWVEATWIVEGLPPTARAGRTLRR